MEAFWKKVSGVALVAVIAFGLIVSSLQARPASGGKFRLPFDAQWGKVALPAGDYTFSVDHITSNGEIWVYRGDKAVGIMHPQTFEVNGNQSANSELICIHHDGKVTVRALQLPNVGTFYFSLPKDLKVLVAQQSPLIETVSVQVGGE